MRVILRFPALYATLAETMCIAMLTKCCALQYDLSVSTFSPDGRVFQTDYAQKAIDNSG